MKAPHNRLPRGAAAFNETVRQYRMSAVRDGRVWEINDEQAHVLFGLPCYYCASEPRYIYRGDKYNGAYRANGIDRIDNSIGYTVNNAVSCCSNCNYAKRDLPQQEFIAWLDDVASHRGAA